MAPRVDRTVISMPPRQVELAGPIPQGVDTETDRDLERHRTHSDIESDLLSLFKGQGAAARGDLVVVEPAAPPTAGV